MTRIKYQPLAQANGNFRQFELIEAEWGIYASVI